jgi:hypothetical protein
MHKEQPIHSPRLIIAVDGVGSGLAFCGGLLRRAAKASATGCPPGKQRAIESSAPETKADA